MNAEYPFTGSEAVSASTLQKAHTRYKFKACQSGHGPEWHDRTNHVARAYLITCGVCCARTSSGDTVTRTHLRDLPEGVFRTSLGLRGGREAERADAGAANAAWLAAAAALVSPNFTTYEVLRM